jgi:hypothetical protein
MAPDIQFVDDRTKTSTKAVTLSSMSGPRSARLRRRRGTFYGITMLYQKDAQFPEWDVSVLGSAGRAVAADHGRH